MEIKKEYTNLKERNKANLEYVANVATRWIGSTASLIVHTLLFILAFLLPLFHAINFDQMLLALTTIVSLEAIYLAIFIQMSVNKNSADIETIQEDVEEIQEDIEEIQEDVEEMQEDVEEIQGEKEEVFSIKNKMPTKPSYPNNTNKLHHIQELLMQIQNEIKQLK